MGLFRKTNKDTPPLIPADTPASRRVMETLRLVDLNPDEVLLVGSAALALYGIQLHEFDDPISGKSGADRPGDVDFSSTVDYIEDLYKYGTKKHQFRMKTGSDPLNPHSTQTVLRADTSGLPIDVITRFRDGRDNANKYDEKLRKMIQTQSVLADTAFHIISLDSIVSEVKGVATSGYDPKAQLDLAAIRRARLRH